MKRYLALVASLTIALLFVMALIGGAGRAQGPQGGDQAAAWQSSDPSSAGEQVQSAPDRPAKVDAVDIEADLTYNASWRVAGAALKPRESTVEWTGVGGAGGCIYASSGSPSAVFNTPVSLPQGSTAKYLRMYYDDTNDTSNSTAWFTVYDLYGLVQEEWAVSSSGSNGIGYMTTDEFTHTIDYDTYAYVLNWRPYDLGSDTQVCGFRIFYHTAPGTVFLPLSTKDHAP